MGRPVGYVPQTLGIIYKLGLGLLLAFAWNSLGKEKIPSCQAASKLNLKSSDKLSQSRFLCYEKAKTYYCPTAPKGMDCGAVDFKNALKKWSEASQKTKLSKDKPRFKKLQTSNSYKSLLLASSLELMKLKKEVSFGESFKIQTGPYSGLILNKDPLSKKCFEEILSSAQILQREIPEVAFEISGKIHRCDYLFSGVVELVKNKKLVKNNLKHILSPLHTIYLTDKTDFNNDTLGKMGLYVNVNRKHEIKTRLIDFTVSKKLRMSGLSGR